ncbi:creatinine amidohydrolase [Streptomyces griseochromogenes]|uniref:Creatininase n=1 Tax=Streptomyces griseochromogenes TaxID=68214 RepID=A0A1B1AW42_9ACTN|nr:creatininase family protein [Streptomyces griseochromogenes]ANP50796.1 creatininase [Streptomyces griseochromogenes]MBP2051605.1 creatinine amidohydrolase [Streptomyces griseochromogenes]
MTEFLWNRMTASRLRELAGQNAPVLLPVGSTEQHGPHLPTGVDDFLSTEVCRRVAAILIARHRPVVVAPSLWCGLADHHMAFGGTFSLTLSTYQAVLRDVCSSVLASGFRTILIVNGHGGNVTALNAITNEISRELGTPIAVTSYFLAAQDRFAGIMRQQNHLMHACEGETSMMMALAPELVDGSRIAEATGPEIELYSADQPFHRPRPFHEVTASGVAGDARPATARKGRAMLDAGAERIAAWLLDLPARPAGRDPQPG